MLNNPTIIRNKLSVTKILLSLAISISVGNSMNSKANIITKEQNYSSNLFMKYNTL